MPPACLFWRTFLLCCLFWKRAQLEELQASYEAELQRRSEAERAARDASEVYRGQLAEQRRELDGLQV